MINGKLDELTILCSEITLREYRNEALKIISEIRNFRIINEEVSDVEKENWKQVCKDVQSSGKIGTHRNNFLRNSNAIEARVQEVEAIRIVDDTEAMELETEIDKAFLLKEIRNCPLKFRTENCLRGAKIFYVGDLAEKTEDELLKIKNFGMTCLIEVQAFLATGNLALKST